MLRETGPEYHKMDLRSPELYINRDLSWLEFNQRVLDEGRSDSVPLMERLKFLAIASSNLDEFFMIRVAGLKAQARCRPDARDASGLTPAEQLREIARRAHRMVRDLSEAVRTVLSILARHGLRVIAPGDIPPAQKRLLDTWFSSEILPALTPLAVGQLDPFPVLPALGLNVAVVLRESATPESAKKLAIIPIPGSLPRFVTLPASEGTHLARIEEVVAGHAGDLFPGHEVVATTVFRLIRDADLTIDDDADDLLRTMEHAVRARRSSSVVRVSVAAGADPLITQWLLDYCGIERDDLYEVDGMLDASALKEIASRPGFDALRYPEWPPQPPRDLSEGANLWDAMQHRDLLLIHPYESFEPVVRMLEEAANDPAVLAIKQTLYRTSPDSRVVAALARAAERGKEVTVLVELKARFDESRNVSWARQLEEAGCHVIYGVAGLKTHAKILLVIRREERGLRRYVHVSTGNYNERTARLYSDVGLMTSDRDFAADASAFFNLLTGYSQDVGWRRFSISPTGLRRRLLELIEREIALTSSESPGIIMAKMNSLQDEEMCQALYRASRAGVRVRLNVRGICCLRPGVPGVSDNIEVVSIVDRFLEHARIFCFGNRGHEEVYLSSADWMTRNLDRRLEVLFPVSAPEHRSRLIRALNTYFSDNVKAARLRPDGSYERVAAQDQPRRAQEILYLDAVEAARERSRAPMEFKPLASPSRTSRSQPGNAQ